MITRKILNLIAVILMLSSSVAIADPYTAIIRCGMGEVHANPMICLIESEIKVTKHKRATVYNLYNIRDAGEWHKDALVIDLPESFSIKMNNSADIFILEVIILDKDGNIVFQDQAGENGNISFDN